MQANNSEKDQVSEQQISQFLLAEFEALQGARNLIISLTDNRTSFFFTATSATLVILASVGQLLGVGEALFITSLLVLPGLLLLGVITFLRSLEAHITSYIYVRGMNRIRRYYVDLAPDIRQYLILPANDDIPKFQSVGFTPTRYAIWIDLTAMITIINSVTGAFLTGILLKVFLNLGDLPSIIIGILAFILVIIIHQWHQVMRLQKAEMETKTHFESE